MKYYNIKLPHVHGVGYTYPPGYEENIGQYNQGHVYYDNPDDGFFYIMISVPDKNALPEIPENVTEIDEAAAYAIAEQFDPKVPVITNEAVVRSIEIKSRLEMPLSQKEQDALNLELDEPGFGMSKNFVDKVEANKVLEQKDKDIEAQPLEEAVVQP